jgi:4-oxalocrotonate tautomerase
VVILKEFTMPLIKIQVTNEGVTAEQKKLLIKGATDLLVSVLNKNPATTFVIIEEVETDNWGVGGVSVTERRKQQASKRGG